MMGTRTTSTSADLLHPRRACVHSTRPRPRVVVLSFRTTSASAAAARRLRVLPRHQPHRHTPPDSPTASAPTVGRPARADALVAAQAALVARHTAAVRTYQTDVATGGWSRRAAGSSTGAIRYQARPLRPGAQRPLRLAVWADVAADLSARTSGRLHRVYRSGCR
jgi:hypothetical protein